MSQMLQHASSCLLYDPTELHYDFGPRHPLQAARSRALLDLLEQSGLWSPQQLPKLPFRAATREELSQIHQMDYIEAVQALGQPLEEGASAEEIEKRKLLADKFGFGDGDTPPQPDMHEVSAAIAGGTLVALSAVMGLPDGGIFEDEGQRPLHVFHPQGGLHHAWAERASGFCVYNDAAVAIAQILRQSEAKVLYLDLDAHHGDGVQRAFYDEPRVMTVSLHETGRYLFPGTGDVLEVGSGLGRGYSVNVPLEPFTEDASYQEVLESLLPPLLTSFAPDVIVSQHGCDGHAWDPLTHLQLTLQGIRKQVTFVHELAHTYCEGRWVALGGGGYDLYRVVPRAWSIVWAEMSGQTLPEKLPQAWVDHWQPIWKSVEEQDAEAQEVMGNQPAPTCFPLTFQDRPGDFLTQPRRWQISHTNRLTASLVRHLLLPSSIRQAFPSSQRRSPMAGLFDLLHLRGSATPSRTKTLNTPKGAVLLRDFCPPSLVERLRADEGLKAFARLPEREHKLLLNISKRPDCALALAHTPNGEIVGEVTLAPGDEWWEGLENVYEIAIEVSSNWRNVGIAHSLLSFALELDALEDMILFAIGLAWHWDMQGLDISVYKYRKLIIELFGSQGFTEYPTTEPNVTMEPANVLLARIGSRVDARASSSFFNRLLNSSNLSRY